MLTSEIVSSCETDSHFDETIASLAKKVFTTVIIRKFLSLQSWIKSTLSLSDCLSSQLVFEWFILIFFFFKQLLPTHYSFNWLIFPVVLNAFFFLAQTVDTRGHVEHWHISPHLQPFSKYGRLNSIKGYLGVVCVRPYKARLQSVKWCHFQQPVWHTGEFPRWTWFVSWVWILVILKELVRVNIVVSCCAGGLAWSL